MNRIVSGAVFKRGAAAAIRAATNVTLAVYPSRANFLFVELPDGVSGRTLRDRLLENHGVMIRECSNKTGATEQYLRVAVQGRRAVDVLVAALHDELTRMTASYSALSAA